MLIFIVILFNHNLVAQSSRLVFLQDNKLEYAKFPVQDDLDSVNRIPDFSYAGYRGGGIALPQARVVVKISPTGSDDWKIIQEAIDSVSSLPKSEDGIRGAVLLRSGHYQVSDELFIRTGGVILRGEGQGKDGTILHANKREKHDLITVQGRGEGFKIDEASRQNITTKYVPLGAMQFSVADASIYQIGDTIAVIRTPNQAWVDRLGMGEELCEGIDRKCTPWTPESYIMVHERVITDISGKSISINIPIVDVLDEKLGGGEIAKASLAGRIEKVGIENLRIESYYASEEDEDHGWSAIRFNRTVNSWLKGVTAQFFGYGLVNIGQQSSFNTIEDCAVLDHKSQIKGGRRYSYVINDGLGNLVQRCYSSEGRHDFAMGARVTGPNVFVDCYSINTHADIGPHHRWTVGTLFDNIYGGQIRVRNRKHSGTGHGWAGNATMFWNLNSHSEDLMVESPPGGVNWGIGCAGQKQNGAGYWESWGAHVLPRSLYFQQLEERMGREAFLAVTIPSQRQGSIYDLLDSWAGEGRLIQE